MLFILYAALLAASRTDGFRSLVEDRLSSRVGYNIAINRLALSLGLDLRLEEVSLTEEGRPEPFLKVDAADLTFEWANLFRQGQGVIRQITVNEPDLLIRERGDSGWQPAALGEPMERIVHAAGLKFRPDRLEQSTFKVVLKEPGEMDKPEQVVQQEESAQAGGSLDDMAAELQAVQVHINDGIIRWLGKDGQIMASLQGLELHVTPLDVPGRSMHHYKAVMNQLRVQHQVTKNLRIEMMILEDNQIVLGLDADWGGMRE